VDELREAIDELAAVDVDTLTDSELHDAVIEIQRQRARLGVVAARLVEGWSQRGVWAGDGSRSAAARLARDTHTSVGSARVEVGRGRQLAGMPKVAIAVDDGRLSLDHVDLLGRARRPGRETVFADHEAELVEHCTTLRYTQAAKAVAYWCQRVDADRVDADAERHAESVGLHASTTLDGMVAIDGLLDPIGGAALTAELARLEHHLYLDDERAGVVRTARQRRAAALVEMARRSAAAPGDARPARPLFSVLLGDHTFTNLCELSNGHVVTPGQLIPWIGDADLETILFAGPSTVVSVSHRRSFSGALRRAIQVRDRHCQHPAGCDEPADSCDVDHIEPWAAGGVTSQFNGRLECRPHNRHPHRHDHHTTPPTQRPVTRLDELRVRLRWRLRHHHPDEYDDTGLRSRADRRGDQS
jgi:hypothetical protein